MLRRAIVRTFQTAGVRMYHQVLFSSFLQNHRNQSSQVKRVVWQ